MSDDEFEAGGGHLDDSDLSLPKATIEKLIKEMLPANTTCAKDTRDMLGECCKVFLNLLTQAANEICDKEQKKTITGEHIMSALEQIGFADYVPELQAESADHQKTMKESQGKSSSKKLNKSGLSPEELLRQQQELFEQARQAYESGQPSASDSV